MDNLGAYIWLLNDERFIRPCINSVKKVFPQVEVVDLGSRDRSIERAESCGVKVHRHTDVTYPQFTEMKNDYCKRNEWAFSIDADEVYPESSLLKIKKRVESDTKFESIRVAWRMVKEEDDKIFQSNHKLINGKKIFKSSRFTFNKPWPFEVHKMAKGVQDEQKHHYNGVWCWHMVMCKRGPIEDSMRKNKRLEKLRMYNKELEWEELPSFPWE